MLDNRIGPSFNPPAQNKAHSCSCIPLSVYGFSTGAAVYCSLPFHPCPAPSFFLSFAPELSSQFAPSASASSHCLEQQVHAPTDFELFSSSENSSQKCTIKKKKSQLLGNQRRFKDQLGFKSDKDISDLRDVSRHRTKSMQAKAEGER